MNEAERQRLAAIVRRCRRSQSQDSFAQEIGVGQSSIAEWEKGRVPSLENLERIALRIGLTPERLLAEIYERPMDAMPDLLDQVRAASPAVKAQILRLLADELERGKAVDSSEHSSPEPTTVNGYSAAPEPPAPKETTTPQRRKTGRRRAE